MEMALAVGLIALIALPVVKYLGTELRDIFVGLGEGLDGIDASGGGYEEFVGAVGTGDGKSGAWPKGTLYLRCGCKVEIDRVCINDKCSEHAHVWNSINTVDGYGTLACGLCQAPGSGYYIYRRCIEHGENWDCPTNIEKHLEKR